MDKKSLSPIKIIITFILFSLSISLTAEEKSVSLDKIVAIINDDVVTKLEIDSEVEKLKTGLKAQRITAPSDDELKKQILQKLIDERIQLQMAEMYGMSATDTQVNEAVNNIAQKNRMSLTNLKYALLKEGIEFSEFRDNLKKQLTIQNIQQASIFPNINITKQEIEQFTKNMEQNNNSKKYHVGHILLSYPENASNSEINKLKEKANTLANDLKQKTISFKTAAIKNSDSSTALDGGDLGFSSLNELPDLFAIHVQSMQKGEIKGPIADENGLHIIKLFEIKADIPVHKVQKFKVRQILIKNDNITSDTAARMQLDGIRETILKGNKENNFETMAKRYSEDPKTSIKGGNLGWVSEEEVSNEFASNIKETLSRFKNKNMKISEPFKTPQGWHIIEVLGVKEFDESEAIQKKQAKNMLQQKKFNEALDEWLNRIRNESTVKVLM